MYLSKSERLAQWSLLGILLINTAAPFLWNYLQKIWHLNSFYCDILSFVMILSAIVSGVSVIGWIMVCMEKKAGKYFLILCHIPSALTYAIGALYFLVMLIAGYEPRSTLLFMIPVFLQLFVSAATLWLQHFWTRYIF